MFTLEVRINGSLVAHIYGHNLSRKTKAGADTYKYEYYEPGLLRDKVFVGETTHHRDDGIRGLVSNILNRVDAKFKSKNEYNKKTPTEADEL